MRLAISRAFSFPFDVCRLALTRVKLLRLAMESAFKRFLLAALWRWLDHVVQRGLILSEGAGRKTDPFRYWLPEREAVWRQDRLYEILEAQRRQLNLPFQSLPERKKALGDDSAAPFASDGEE